MNDIESVVREVIAEVFAAQKGERGEGRGEREEKVASGEWRVASAENHKSEIINHKSPAPSSLSPLPSPLSPSSGELVIDARVVTKNEILGRLDSVRRVIVSHGAIVTPAVQDELIRRGIAIECVKSKHQPETLRLILITMGTDIESEKLAAVLTREGVKVECAALNCIIAATEQLAAELSGPNTLGALLTRHTAAALCLANRLPGVRAVGGVDAPAVASATAAVGANLLVLDPRTGTFFQLKQMTSEFCRGGVRKCPEVFKGKLR